MIPGLFFECSYCIFEDVGRHFWYLVLPVGVLFVSQLAARALCGFKRRSRVLERISLGGAFSYNVADSCGKQLLQIRKLYVFVSPIKQDSNVHIPLESIQFHFCHDMLS